MPKTWKTRAANNDMSDDGSEPHDDETQEPRAEGAPAAVPPPGRAGASTTVDAETSLAGVMESFDKMQAETNRTLMETLRSLPFNGPWNPATSTPTPDNRVPAERPSAVTGGNFSKCIARFSGASRDAEVLEAFIDAVQVFKECASVSDEHALRGLPMLLEGDAAVWWRGARAGAASWRDALERLRAM